MFRFRHFNSLFVHIKCTSNMAAWFYAQFNDVTAPRIYFLDTVRANGTHLKCNSQTHLFGLPANLIQRLQSVQNAAARLIIRIRRSEHYPSAHQPSLAARPRMYLLQTGSYNISIHSRHLSVLPTVMFHPRFRHDIGCGLLSHASAPSLAVFRQSLETFLFSRSNQYTIIMTCVLLSPFITTVWTPVVLAIINII